MNSTTIDERQKVLCREKEVAIHFHGTPHEAVLFSGPFHSICEWRESYGMKTEVRLDLEPKPVFPVEKLFGGHLPDKPFEIVVDIKPDKNKPFLDDMFRQVMRPSTGLMLMNDFHQNKSLAILEQARRRTPYDPYIAGSYPPRILILPPTAYFKSDRHSTDAALWERMWRDLIPDLIDGGNVCYGPRIENSKVWNMKVLTQLRGHIELKMDTLESVIEAILSSTIVIACQSELSSVSSMLYVPTLTIYGCDHKWDRYMIKGKGLPSFSCPMNRIENISSSYVTQAISRLYTCLVPIH